MADDFSEDLPHFVPPSARRKEAALLSRLLHENEENYDSDFDVENEGDPEEVNSSKVHWFYETKKINFVDCHMILNIVLNSRKFN